MAGQPGRSGRKGIDRKPSPWPEGFDLKMKENVDAFLIHYIQEFWRQNPLDARAGGCLNNALRLYYDAQGWITKAPLQIIQAQTVIPADISRLLEVANADEQIVIAKAIKRLEESENSSRNR